MSDSNTTTAPTATTPPAVKPGWKTTEFWLSLAAKLLGAAFAFGLVGDGSKLDQIAGLVAVVLSSLGYQVNRTRLKLAAGAIAPAALVVLVLLGGVSLQACAWLKGEADAAKKATIDCTIGTARDAVQQFAPVVDALLAQAADPNGKVNWAPVKDLTKGFGVELGGCVLASVVAKALTPTPPDPNAPKASELVLDAASLRAGFDDVRKTQLGGATFKTSAGVL